MIKLIILHTGEVSQLKYVKHQGSFEAKTIPILKHIIKAVTIPDLSTSHHANRNYYIYFAIFYINFPFITIDSLLSIKLFSY